MLNYLEDLDKISKLPIHAKCLSKTNYKDHLECHNYYHSNKKTSREEAVKERSYYFSFEVMQGKCIIFQTQHMCAEEEWIVKEAKSTKVAVLSAIKEFKKRYYK
jgi:hypothetical protein